MNGNSGALAKVSTLFSGVVLSKFLGLLRELALAYAFGTSIVADAFRVALSAVLIPTHLLTGEALFSAFIPAYKRLPDSRRADLTQAVATALICCSVVLSLLLLVGAPIVVRLLAPGFGDLAIATSAKILRVAAVGVVLYAVSALLINIHVAHDNYLMYSVRPTVQNLGILAAVVAAYVWRSPALLGLGFVAAFLVMALWSLAETIRGELSVGQIIRVNWRWLSEETREFRRALGQLSIFVIVVQLSLVIDRIVGSLTGVGGVAALDYAFFVTDSTRFLIAVPLATLALGRLSGRDWQAVSNVAQPVLRVVLVATVGLSILFWSVAQDLVTLLYQRGEFQTVSAELTTASLQGFSVGVWAATAGYILLRLFNATLRNREVVVAGASALLLNALLDFALYRPLGVFGVALATSISNMLLLVMLLGYGRLVKIIVGRSLPPALALLLVIPLLARIKGEGLTRLSLATSLTVLCTAAVCWIWPPIRQDLRWVARKLLSRPGGAV